MIQIIQVVVPVFLVIAVGHVLMRLGLFSDQFLKESNRLIFNFFLPVLIFNKLSGLDFESVLTVFLVIVVVGSIVVTYIISYLLARFWRLSSPVVATFTSSTFRANLAYIGLPVCYYAFGDHGLAIASVVMALVIPLNNILSVLVFNTCSTGNLNLKIVAGETICNPLVIACLIGAFFAWLHIPVPGFIGSTLGIISGITLPLALLAIGATVNYKKINGNRFLIFSSCLLKLIFHPLTAYLAFAIAGIQDELGSKIAVILVASPSAALNYLFAAEMKGDPELASSIIVATTTLSIVSYVFWLHYLGIP